MTERGFTPEYLSYLERRYNDIRQVLEAVLSAYPPAAIDENHLVDVLQVEFDYLANVLGFEDLEAFLLRLPGQDADNDEDDELPGQGDREIPPDYEN